MTAPTIDIAGLHLVQQSARVDELRQAKYESILEGNDAIELVRGTASFKDSSTLMVTRPDGSEQILRADNVLIATGSSPAVPPVPGLADVPFWARKLRCLPRQDCCRRKTRRWAKD